MRRSAFLARPRAAAASPALRTRGGRGARGAAVRSATTRSSRDVWRELGGRSSRHRDEPERRALDRRARSSTPCTATRRSRSRRCSVPSTAFAAAATAGETVGSSVDERPACRCYSLYGATRHPTQGDARRHRRAAVRHPGRRRAAVHLRVDDGVRDGSGGAVRQGRLGPRPAESDRRRADRRSGARAEVQVVHRPLSDPRTARHDGRRAGAHVQRAFRHRLHAARHADAGLDARDAVVRHRPALGSDVAEHAVRAHDARVPRDRPGRRSAA